MIKERTRNKDDDDEWNVDVNMAKNVDPF